MAERYYDISILFDMDYCWVDKYENYLDLNYAWLENESYLLFEYLSFPALLSQDFFYYVFDFDVDEHHYIGVFECFVLVEPDYLF